MNRQTIKYGFYSGIFFAIGMALFDYFDREGFNFWKFIFNLFFFGFFMGLVFRPTFRNKLNREDKTEMENNSEN
ncbi:hypothetical protein [Psychroflexus aestuariivivens]|uniref:hypothetical protein n=1 Tax=Psychroflexus aestuariivivens TaxID=1795040 RepID=UPI001EFFFD5F|nr:hypothetical protein [Psychroflexus aestuariivivens]